MRRARTSLAALALIAVVVAGTRPPPAHAVEPTPVPAGDAVPLEPIDPVADRELVTPVEPIELPEPTFFGRPPPEDFEPGGWPLLAAILPGILIHGSGVYAAGDTDTALKLLAAEGIGIAGVLAGGAIIIGTGANRHMAGPAIVTLGAGFALFAQSWLADLYGSIANGGVGRPLRVAPLADLRVGYRYVYDPQFEYANFVHLRGDVMLGPFRLVPQAMVALDDDNYRLRLITAYRFWGLDADASTPLDHGSFVDLELGLTWHHSGTEGFDTLTPEIFVLGRLDLSEFAEILAGSFAEFGAGWGMEMYDYRVPGLEFAEDAFELLLMRFAYGLYLGYPGEGFPGYGELMLYYDHRHDDYTAGLGLGGLAGGPAGHFGLEGHWIIAPDADGDGWGVGAEVVVGSAWLTGLDVIYRFGGR